MINSDSPNYFEDLSVSKRKSGLLVPTGADVLSANAKIAEQYEKDAIDQAVGLMKYMTAEELASFLSTKANSVEIIANES